MVNYGKVKSKEKPKFIEITDTAVFIASNIQPYEEQYDNYVVKGYEYDYLKYSINEYIAYISQKNEDLQNQLLDTQMALCEIYESLEGDTL